MSQALEFEVSLMEIKPRIWRRFILREDASFADLHAAIQDAGPWQGYHLWEFRRTVSGHALAAAPDPENPYPAPDARNVSLGSYFRSEKDSCVYVYDFGDTWLHRVTFRRRCDIPLDYSRQLISGARAFPLEDSGGVPGYFTCLIAMGALPAGQTPYEVDADELEEKREWIPLDWVPESFDLIRAKRAFDRKA